eukprot:76770-Rhodomonas_salina.1
MMTIVHDDDDDDDDDDDGIKKDDVLRPLLAASEENHVLLPHCAPALSLPPSAPALDPPRQSATVLPGQPSLRISLQRGFSHSPPSLHPSVHTPSHLPRDDSTLQPHNTPTTGDPTPRAWHPGLGLAPGLSANDISTLPHPRRRERGVGEQHGGSWCALQVPQGCRHLSSIALPSEKVAAARSVRRCEGRGGGGRSGGKARGSVEERAEDGIEDGRA